jgi:hypothetical protein
LTIYDSQNKVNSIWIKDISFDHDSQTNSDLNIHNQMYVKNDIPYLIFVKAKTSVNLNMPFKLVVRENEETIIYYKLNDNEKYRYEIEYSIEKEFIQKNIPSTVIDSIEKKGYKFYTGKLVSNKVTLQW